MQQLQGSDWQAVDAMKADKEGGLTVDVKPAVTTNCR
jgi:hypothetical protein